MTEIVRIYLDACCLSRLTDDKSQSRVRAEAQSVEKILRPVRLGLAIWVGSSILTIEVGQNPDPERRRDTESLLAFANECVVPGRNEADRAVDLQSLGFSAFDALHLAIDEQNGVDVFLTTDDGLLRRARRHCERLLLTVENPVSWYQESQS